MKELKELDYYKLEESAIQKIKKKHKKILKKVSKKILKQVKKNPMQRYYEINIEKYSLDEMQVIKRYFCDWLGFGFEKTIPEDDMTVISNIGYITTISTNIDYPINVKPLSKFYITWFKD